MNISAKRLKELKVRPDGKIDYSDIPELDESFFANMKLLDTSSKKHITIRFDEDVVDWFKSQGKGYQKRMNAVLRAYVHARQSSSDTGL